MAGPEPGRDAPAVVVDHDGARLGVFDGLDRRDGPAQQEPLAGVGGIEQGRQQRPAAQLARGDLLAVVQLDQPHLGQLAPLEPLDLALLAGVFAALEDRDLSVDLHQLDLVMQAHDARPDASGLDRIALVGQRQGLEGRRRGVPGGGGEQGDEGHEQGANKGGSHAPEATTSKRGGGGLALGEQLGQVGRLGVGGHLVAPEGQRRQ